MFGVDVVDTQQRIRLPPFAKNAKEWATFILGLFELGKVGHPPSWSGRNELPSAAEFRPYTASTGR